MSTVEALLKRERAFVAIALASLLLLAWSYLWRGAGMGMSALQMTSLAFFPHIQPEPMPGMAAPVPSWLTVIAMWWVMMIAMMTPSAAPLLLLYGRVLRQMSSEARMSGTYASPLLLAAGYLAVWLAFSIAAAAIQYLLARAEFISDMVLWSQSAVLSASVLIGAGLYQLSPLKHACLNSCRAPIQFLTQRWRPGRLGALAMGLEHGLWCVGCCWVLMLLLFVGGVMNVVWIALLALLVLAERLAPSGATISRICGVALIAWGAVTLIV